MPYFKSKFGQGGRSNSTGGSSSSGRSRDSRYTPSRGGQSSSRGGGFQRSQSRPTRRNPGERIPIDRFINKAVNNVEAGTEYVHKYVFTDFPLDPILQRNIARKGVTIPTPIQDQAIPLILEGKDLIGIASTGTGKTMAFLLPLLNKIAKNAQEKVLIVTPTRELALQIEAELHLLTIQLNIQSVLCIGGTSIGKQMSGLKRPYRFLIGTPGRLKDLTDRRAIKMDSFTVLVLDEVDRMLDMGFAPAVKEIVSQLVSLNQSLFFSATIDPKVTSLIGQIAKNPVTVRIKSRETAESVEQDVVRITRGESKIDVLHKLIVDQAWEKILIFGRTKFGVERLAQDLVRKGLKAESIHGNKSQAQRQRALALFKEGKVSILTATDVAARGLDIPGITHVINYDVPATYADYIHRIGRTGRAKSSGKALTFVEV